MKSPKPKTCIHKCFHEQTQQSKSCENCLENSHNKNKTCIQTAINTNNETSCSDFGNAHDNVTVCTQNVKCQNSENANVVDDKMCTENPKVTNVDDTSFDRTGDPVYHSVVNNVPLDCIDDTVYLSNVDDIPFDCTNVTVVLSNTDENIVTAKCIDDTVYLSKVDDISTDSIASIINRIKKCKTAISNQKQQPKYSVSKPYVNSVVKPKENCISTDVEKNKVNQNFRQLNENVKTAEKVITNDNAESNVSKLKIVSANLAGWTTRNNDLRQKILLSTKADIICVQETHGDQDKVIDINGYHFFRHDRTVKNKKSPHTFGGIGIFVKNSLFTEFNFDIAFKSIDGILGLYMVNKFTLRNYIIICVYLPPENSIYGRCNTEYFANLLTQMYKYNDVDGCVICGDINGRIGNLKDFVPEIDDIPEREIIDNTVNNHGKSLIEFMLSSKCCVLNGRFDKSKNNFTCLHRGRSVVDYMLTPHEFLRDFKNFEVIPIDDIVAKENLFHLLNSKSKQPDHCVLSVDMLLYTRCEQIENTDENVENISNEPKFVRRYKLNERPTEMYNSEMSKLALNNLINEIILLRENQEQLDIMYKQICDTIKAEMDKLIPYKDICTSKKAKKRFKHSKPFWNNELKILWQEMHENEIFFLRYRGNDPKHKSNLRNIFIGTRKIFDKKLRFHKRKYNRGTEIELEEICKKDPTKFWNQIKNLGPKRKINIPMEIVNNDHQIITETEKILDKWKEDFKSLYNVNIEKNNDFDNKFLLDCKDFNTHLENNMLDPLYDQNSTLNRNFTIEEISNAINKTKNNKSTGTDKIPYEALKYKNVIKLLKEFYQFCFDTALVPNIWRKAIINPIPKDKRKDQRIPLNYRGISLLNTILKIYSSTLNNRFMEFDNIEELIVDEQNGFRKRRSCVEHIFTLNSVIRNNLNQNKQICCAFIDFKKAFDFVNRDLLFYKLLVNKIDGKFFNAVKQMYTNTEACVKVNDMFTDWFKTDSGVKQGDCLSSSLFNLYINDLAKEIKNLNKGVKIADENVGVLFYADDLVVIAENEDNLTEAMQIVQKYCVKWRIQINQEKSQVIHFRNKNVKRSNRSITIGNNELVYTDKYKYLGVLFNEHLSFEDNANQMADSASRALGALINKFQYIKNMGFETYFRLFNSCVMPVMEYGAEIWGFKEYRKTDQVLYNAIRYYLGVHKFTPIIGLLGETGRVPTMYSRWTHMLRLWNHLIQLPENRLVKRIFNVDHHMKKNNWCTQIDNILSKLGMHEHFVNKKYVCIENVRNNLKVLYEEKWSSKVDASPKLRTYKIFKKSLEIEDYLKYNLSRAERSILAQFRLGVLPLRLETGRFVREDIDKRICTFCNNGEIENEAHFLLRCNVYDEIRNLILGESIDKITNYTNMSENEKIISIINGNCRKHAKYLVAAFDKRKLLLNDI